MLSRFVEYSIMKTADQFAMLSHYIYLNMLSVNRWPIWYDIMPHAFQFDIELTEDQFNMILYHIHLNYPNTFEYGIE